MAVSRRAFFAAVLGVTSSRVMADQPGGFSVVLPCTSTPTEEAEQAVNFGKHIYMVVADKDLWPCAKACIGRDVRVTLVPE